MDTSAVAREHPSMERTTERSFWDSTFQADPDIMLRLLGDLWRTLAVARGDAGALPRSVDELFDLVVPDYSSDPFPVALRAKLGSRSIRWLAGQLHLHHSHVTRWINGERDIVNMHNPAGSMESIEAIAKAVGVHPSYFAEWRRLWLLQLLDDSFTRHPNLSIGVWKRFGVFAPAPLNGR